MAKKKVGKIIRIKRKTVPVEGNTRSRKVKAPKEKGKAPVTESGKEFQDEENLVKEAKRISSRKFKVPKPASLVSFDDDKIEEGEGETKLAPIPRTRKVKRKKKK